ncbi:piggyBac transposable element-derived protein 4 [Aplysia californica]|uniref:PiggyBac transposable element-derived protein 4 n=1 Tax=Aplysia californica TaxID=6500 RepID=A0ABM0K7Y6_APLCA|nr:piggyBac transposable element-derived protein 4 [Aplysia californica]
MADGGDEAGPSSGRRQRLTAQQALGLFQTLASDDNLASEREVEFSDGGSDSDGERNAMNFESDTMGLEVRPSVSNYWSTEEIMYNAFYHIMFRRERFESIYHTMLHCSDPDSENKHKIELLIDAVMEASREAFYPFQNLSIDEMVVGFTGRWKFKQYNPSKPKKYHIKTFGLVDSTKGFVLRVFPYFGRHTSYNPALDHNSGMAIKVFDTLLKDVLHDRSLVGYLSGRSLYYTGTLNLNRKYFPPQLKNIKTMKHMEAKHYLRNGESMLVTAWKDKKAKNPCVVVSTKAEKSFYTNAKNKTKPTVVNNYNMSTGGSDKVDQRVTYYSNTDRKSYKWWKKQGFFFGFSKLRRTMRLFSMLLRENREQQR